MASQRVTRFIDAIYSLTGEDLTYIKEELGVKLASVRETLLRNADDLDTAMARSDEVAQCNCGGLAVIRPDLEDQKYHWFIECPDCGERTAYYRTISEAIHGWECLLEGVEE